MFLFYHLFSFIICFFIFCHPSTDEHKLQNKEKNRHLIENENFKINISSSTSKDTTSLINNNSSIKKSDTQKKAKVNFVL